MRIPLLCVLAAPAFGQITAPMLGYVAEGGSVRPVAGIAAVATFGYPLDLNLSKAFAAPNGSHVLGVKESGEIVVFRPGNGVENIPAESSPESMVLSPNGSAAALWFGERGRLQVLSGLPAAPVVREIEARFVDSPTAIAVSDDGQMVAISEPRGLFLFRQADAPLWIAPEARALAFLHRSQVLLVVSNSGVDEFSHPDTGTASRRLMDSPVLAAIGVSAGNRLLVARDNTRALTALDLETGIVSHFDCQCDSDRMLHVSGSVFLVGRTYLGMPHLFDAATGDSYVALPALETEAGQ